MPSLQPRVECVEEAVAEEVEAEHSHKDGQAGKSSSHALGWMKAVFALRCGPLCSQAQEGQRGPRTTRSTRPTVRGFLLAAARPISRSWRRGSTCSSSRARPRRRSSCSGSSPTLSSPIGVGGSGPGVAHGGSTRPAIRLFGHAADARRLATDAVAVTGGFEPGPAREKSAVRRGSQERLPDAR